MDKDLRTLPGRSRPLPARRRSAGDAAAALALPTPVAETFLEGMGLMAGVFDGDGRARRATKLHPICAEFHHRCPATRSICLLHDPGRLTSAIDPEREWSEYLCPNGLFHAIAPLRRDGQNAGSLVLGQFLFERPDEAAARERARTHGWDEEAYLAALREVPVLSHQRVAALIRLFSGFGSEILHYQEAERRAIAEGESMRAMAVMQSLHANDSDALLRAVINDLPGLVALKDENGRYLMANPTLAALYGTVPQAMLGKLDAELISDPETLSSVHDRSLEVLASDETRVVDQPMRDQASGQFRHFRLTKRPFAAADGSRRLLIVGQEITELLLAQEESRLAHRRLEFALDMAGDAVWEWDIASGRIEHNAQWNRVLGVEAATREHSYDEFLAMVHSEDRAEVEFKARLLATEGLPYRSEHRVVTASGRWIWLQVRGAVAKRDALGRPSRVIGRAKDISAEREAAEAQRIAAVTFESQEGMVVTDRAGKILRVNRAFTELTGYEAEEVIGKTPAVLASGRHGQDFYRAMWAQLSREGRWQGEIWNRHKSSKVYPEWLTITAVRDELGAVSHYVGAFLDITEQKEAQGKISELAFYDALTGLPNRRLLLDRLSETKKEHRAAGQHGALIFLDLDHFKTLNDTLGHDVGDEFLRLVAQRLRELMRADDTVSRLGGDEFVVVLPELGKRLEEAAARAAAVAQRVCDALGQPYEWQGRTLYSSASLGVCLFPDSGSNAESLLKHADLALYKAKSGGRNQVRFYSPELQSAVDERARIEVGLRRALERKQFELHFQRQIDAAGTTTGAEALLRWRNDAGDLVLPGRFISVAEDTGLIVPIGAWVIDEACAQLAAWAQNPSTASLSLSVNVSERQTRQANFVDTIRKAIERHRIDPNRLKLELTESLVISDMGQIVAKMSALRELGVLFSMDDFGTGYSSLSVLRRLPLDQIKIDQSFVRGLARNEEDGVIVRAIVAMSRSLQLRVLAEGVETEGQFAILRELGCDAYQGFLFGRPLPAGAFEASLTQT